MINEFNFNETYSSWKDSCKFLTKEMSSMKEKNDFLNQKVKDLESLIFSVIQRTLTKEEMKTMPFGEIWTEYCRVCGVPADGEWFADVKKYEAAVLSKRG